MSHITLEAPRLLDPVEKETQLDLVVADREVSAEGVVTLVLTHADSEELPAWTPGAHIDLHLDNGLVRQYSLCGRTTDTKTWRIAVRIDPESRGGSAHVHARLAKGSRVTVSGPRNHFRLEQADRYIFVAGGIGITPLIPMIAALAQAGTDWTLVYGGRSLRAMPFVDMLTAQYGDRVTVWPEDTHGLIDLASTIPDVPDDTLVYCCGPEPLMQAVMQRCGPDAVDRLRFERFSSEEPAVPDGADAFEVQLDASGEVITVGSDESILDALRRSGMKLESSCEGGICGTCETGVIDGEVDHRDSVLTPSERESGELMMICVSRANCPRLVLDL